MSSISWLDFSDAERRRALQIVELLAQPETRDELGLGAIRDAFAEALFPGTSTVQRRARYFLLIPWTFREIERRHWGSPGALERARREELRLIEFLLQGGETDGVIGGRARKNLRQVPSMIYWQGRAVGHPACVRNARAVGSSSRALERASTGRRRPDGHDRGLVVALGPPRATRELAR